MGAVTDRAESQMYLSAQEDRSSAEKRGAASAKEMRGKRDQQFQQIKDTHDRAATLIHKAEDAKDQGWFSDACDWVSGTDKEGEIQEEQLGNSNGLDKTTKEIDLAIQKQKDELAKVKETDSKANQTTRSVTAVLDETHDVDTLKILA